MKFFVISMLFAAAAAQDGYECVNPGDEYAWTVETLTGDAATDAATCKANCQTFIDAFDIAHFYDWCCAVAVPEVGDVTCGLLSYSTVADADIRAEANAVEGTTFEAWAWAAGVEIEEEEEVVDDEEDDDEEDDDEDDEDMSVRMTLSALATASIAMLAM